MTSTNSAETFRRALLLLSATLLLHAADASADAGADAQAQARNLLDGKAPTQAPQPDRSAGIPALPSAGPQEHARQLILGTQSSSDTGASALRLARALGVNQHETPRARSDARALAQRLILGRPG